MTSPRIDVFRTMIERQPDHAMARFGLATELAKSAEHLEATEQFAEYLARHDDEGNGWMRYAESLHALGRDTDSRDAIEKGISAANRFGHAGLVSDLEALLDSLN